MKPSFFYLALLCSFFLPVTSSSTQADSDLPLVADGLLDLRGYNLNQPDPVPLKGSWKFLPGLARAWAAEEASPIQVPGSWEGTDHRGHSMSALATGTYFLTVLLPSETPPLALYLPEISTSFELLVNGLPLAKAGQIGQAGETTPLFQPQTVRLPKDTAKLQIMIRVANFHRWRGGLLHPPLLGSQETIAACNAKTVLEGGILGSVLAVLGLIFLGFFAFRPKEKYHLWFSVTAFLWAINVAQLTQRFGYLLLGEQGWAWAFRLEYMVLMGVSTSIVLMFNAFYPGLIAAKVLNRVLVLIGLEFAFVLLAPFPWVTYIEAAVLLNYLVNLSGVYFILKAYRQKREAALFFLVLLGASLVPWLWAGAILAEPIDSVQPLHYGLALMLFSLAVILTRRSGRAFRSVEFLSQDLEVVNRQLEKTNRKLEKTNDQLESTNAKLEVANDGLEKANTQLEVANLALEERNQTLEEEVNRRTQQLVALEKKAYEMELERKNRDMETLSATNLMKLKFKKNLIGELEALQKDPKDLEKEIRLMTFDLKRQVATEEKMGALQGDMEKVNTDFYQRLQRRFPKLTKTEREFCAYIKLNLSSQDIADLRKGTLNSINVTRSRIRKKLGLDKGMELQAFIQQI